jgi:hypothetical protein
MSQDEPINQTWQLSLSDADQALIDRIKHKIADGKAVTLKQEQWRCRVHAYPPAPLAEIEATETALGFQFPALIRELWLQVGNGGFGPGYGVIGVGTGVKIYDYDATLVQATDYLRQTADYLKKYLDDALAETHLSEEHRLDAEAAQADYDQWYCNNTFLIYCYWGCNVTTIVDCGDPDLPIYALDSTDISSHTSKTLRQFWQDWLDGEVQQY